MECGLTVESSLSESCILKKHELPSLHLSSAATPDSSVRSIRSSSSELAHVRVMVRHGPVALELRVDPGGGLRLGYGLWRLDVL